MSNDQHEAMIPVEQALVPFYGSEIVAVRLADGRIAAVLSALCDVVRLERTGQLVRIREDEILGEQFLLVQIETPGGPQAVNVLTAWAIPTWLQGVRLSRVAPEKRPAILAFKREAADVLYRHFSRRPALPAPQAVIPAEPGTPPAPVAPPASPPPGASLDEWQTWRQGMRAWLDWLDEMDHWRHAAARRQDELTQRQDAMEQRQDALEDRMESAEEVIRLIPDILERLGPQTLTPEHQQSARAMVKRLHEVSGAAFAGIYAELGKHFHVAKYGDIPDTAWPQVAAWFQRRIAAAEQHHRV